MNIFNYFRKKGIDTVDASFYRKIDEWISWYNSNVRQFTFYKVNTGRGTSKRCRRKSMGMAKKLSEDIADLLLNERVMITLEDEMTQEFVQKVLDNNHFLVMGNDKEGVHVRKRIIFVLAQRMILYRTYKQSSHDRDAA